MRELLLNQHNRTKELRQLSLFFALLLLPMGVWGQTDYGLTVGGVDVTSENAANIIGDNIQGTVSFDVQTSALTLEGATITGNIMVNNLTSLTINVVGENTINAGASSALQSNVATTSCALTFQRGSDLDCSLALNSEGVTVISTGFSTPGYQALALVVDGLDENYDPDYYSQRGLAYYDSNTQSYPAITSATITSYTTYDIIVNGEAVTNLNKNKIRKGAVGVGHITFDGNHTLTLNEVPNIVFDGTYPFIQTSMDLTINLVGNNAFDCGQNVFITRMPGDNDTHTVTFTTDANNPGLLALTVGDQFDGFNKAFENNLQWCPDGYYDTQATSSPVAWVAVPYTEYGITVGGVAVSSGNYTDIWGDNIDALKVSYEPNTKTLTLNTASFSGGITCSDDLTISVIGSGSVIGDITSSKTGGATLTLQHGDDPNGEGATLTIQPSSGDATGFTSVVYDGMYPTGENSRDLKYSPTRQRFETSQWGSLSYNDIYFSSTKTYELWIGGTKVTEENLNNVLKTEEPTVAFNPEGNVLTLNDMTLTGTSIYDSGIISRLSNLSIVVNGENVININDSCSAIRADLEGAQSLSIQKGSDGCSLTLDGSRVIRDFKTLTVTGLSWNDNNFTYQYDTSLPNFNNGYRLMKADGEEASKNYDTGFKPALYDESVETYDLWVAGVQVTSANADDITASAIVEGKISFDAAKNVLTFERATIDLENVYMGIPVASGIAALTVNLVGDNTVTPNYNAQFFAKYTGEAEAPTLTFDTEGFMDDGIYWLGSLTLNNLEEIGSVANGYEFDLEESPENVYPQDAGAATTGWKVSVNTDDNPYVKVWRLEVFDLWIGDGRVISSDIRGGKDNAPYYNPVTDRLVCYDNCEYPIISSMPALTVEIDGECTIAPTTSSPAISFQEKGEVTSGTLTFVRADDAQSASITLTANGENNSSEPYKAIEGFSAANITVGEGLFLKSHATMAEALEATTVTIGDPTGYALYIGDTQVTDANATDVLGDGKVSFTVSGGQEAAPTYTLTLNGAALTAPVKVGLANLTFDIRGNNTITTNTTCIQNTATTGVPSLTFKSNADVVGSLTLTNNSDETDDGVISSSFYSNNTSYYTISKELALIILRNGEYTFNTYYFTAGEVHNVQFVPSYGVQIGETQIYEGNAADVFGDGTVSFDKTKNILTLNGASLSGPLSTSLATLTVDLIGENTLRNYYDGHVIETPYGDDVTITFKSSADVKGMLTMTMNYSQDGNMASEHVTMEYTSPLSVISGSMTGNVGNKSVVIGVNYGITINTATAGIVITNQNRMDVLNDGNKTVQFDGRNTLILNGADIAGIVIGATSPLNTTDGLIVHLTGNNTITNGTKAIANEGNAMPLTLTTSDVEQGELKYICTTCTLTVANSAFSGFTPIKYNDNLAASLDAEANPQVVTIVAVMEPFVTQPGEEHKNTEDGNGLGLGVDIQQAIAGLSADAATTLLGEGVIVNKILYTLPGDNDGYIDDHDYVTLNGKVVALNTPMDDGEVNDILEYIKNGLIQPGTKLGDPYTFAYYFHGMSFLLPAGYGEISLDFNTNEAGVLHVKVGNNEPVSITGTKDLEGKIGFETIKIPYALTEESYVFIYRYAPSSSSRADDHRAPGRKETTTVGIKGLSVSASDVSAAPEPALSPKKLDKSLLVKEGNHITVKDMDVEDIEVDAFDELSGDITYVDLRQTSIKGMSVNRMISDDLFKKLPEKTFIYLPAGNEVITGTKNVVVGSVCNDMELDAAAPFEASKDFVAVKAVHARDFSTMLDKHCTVYLPFALDEEQASSLGTFYEMTGIADGKIMFTSVKETKANMPYMFKPAKETVSAKMVEVKATIPGAPVVGSATFEGTYNQKSILSDASTQYYCFKAEDGILVHVIDNSMTVDPFRCYIKVTGGASLGRFLDIVVDDETTAVKNIKVGSEDNVYYDLSGRRVLYPKKGMYIMNGKKVIIK